MTDEPPPSRTRLGREPPRAGRAARRRDLPGRHAHDHRGGDRREPRRRRASSHRDPRRPRARPDRGGAGRDRRARLVGARGARRGRATRSSSGCTGTCSPGMGLVVLHSGHWSKIFTKLMGTSCTLRWRAEHDRELVWTVDPTHPIARGVPHPIVIDEEEMYGEFFDIPAPDELVFSQHVQRRRGVPLRLHVPARPRQDLLLPARRPGLPDLPPPGRPPGHRERRRVGRHRPAGAGAPDAAALRDRRLLQRPRLRRARSRSRRMPDPLRLLQVGAGGMGRAWLRTIADNPDVDLVGLVDLDVDVARAAADEHGYGDVPVAASIDELAGDTRTRSSTSPCRPRIPRSAWMPCCVASGALREAAGRVGPRVPGDGRGVR